MCILTPVIKDTQMNVVSSLVDYMIKAHLEQTSSNPTNMQSMGILLQIPTVDFLSWAILGMGLPYLSSNIGFCFHNYVPSK